MDGTRHAGLIYVISTGLDPEARVVAEDLRARLPSLLEGDAAIEHREIPGALWGFVPTAAGAPDRIERARSGPRECVVRGDPVPLDPDPPGASGAETLLRHWEREGAGAARRLDNLFVSVVADEERGELSLITDPTGGIRLFETTIQGAAVLCTSYLVLARWCSRRVPDADSIATFFHLGYFPGLRTALEDVRVHPCGAVTRLRAGGRETAAYWTPSMAPSGVGDAGDAVDRMVQSFNRTVQEHSAGHDRALLAMTAGLDSRTILSSLIHQRIPYDTYTHGFPGCWEGRMVDRLVRRHSIPHRFVPLDAAFRESLGELIPRCFAITEGEISSIEKSHLLYVLSTMREDAGTSAIALLLGGGAGMLKGTYHRLLREEETYSEASLDAFLQWNFQKRLPDIFHPGLRARDPGLLREIVGGILDEPREGTFFQRLDYLYLVRYRRWAGAVKSIYRRFFPVREPFVGVRVLDELFGLDPALKGAEVPHFAILGRNQRSLQYDLTNKMTPALPFRLATAHRFVPSIWWRIKQVIRGASRRYLPKEIFPLVDYVDYPSWIRVPEVRAIVEELLDPDRMETAFLYDASKVREWLRAERARGFSTFSLVDKMCTLELFFREIRKSRGA